VDRYDVAIIGAGPAGLFCAIHAAGAGLSVVLIEKNSRPGEKLRISGTGQCNITHDGEMQTFLTRYGSHGRFLKPALFSFTNKQLTQFFSDRGLSFTMTSGGKIFPVSRDASDVCDILVHECERIGVRLHCGDPVAKIETKNPGFAVYTRKSVFFSDILVIATGGASFPATGSTGDGYRFAASFGHKIAETGPALTPVLIEKFPLAHLAGMTFPDLPFSVWRDNRKIARHQGDVVITHTGFSGPGILDCSRDIRSGDELRFAFVGSGGRDKINADFSASISQSPAKNVRSLVVEMNIPERLARVILDRAGIAQDCTGAHLSATYRNRLVDLLTEFPFTVTALGDLSGAMVTRGGVELSEVNSRTLESTRVPGLFFAGEVLDIDGDTGGFNLQAAFSTGYLASRGVLAHARKPPE